jgi:cystathionine beta-lyase/cystathionine gamma-synthase
MTHGSVPRDVRKALVIDDSDVRLSTGIEDIEDIIKDIKQTPGNQ